jgi:hypothetical protein
MQVLLTRILMMIYKSCKASILWKTKTTINLFHIYPYQKGYNRHFTNIYSYFDLSEY